MDISSSFKKTFTSHNSLHNKHRRRISIGTGAEEEQRHEQQPILSDHNRQSVADEVIVKIDGGGGHFQQPQPSNPINIHRDSTLEYWKKNVGTPTRESPPTELIGRFLKQKKANGGEMDIDLEMDVYRASDDDNNTNNSTSSSFVEHFPPINDHNYDRRTNLGPGLSKDLRVSFQAPSNYSPSNVVDIGPVDERSKTGSSSDDEDEEEEEEDRRAAHNRRRSTVIMNNNNADTTNNVSASGGGGGEEAQVLKCTSIQRRFSTLGRLKTRSRLLDPPEATERRSGLIKPTPNRSGLLGLGKGGGGEEEEEDPLFDADLPDEYTRTKFDALTMAQWISLIMIVSALICTLSITKWKSKRLRGLCLWKWEVLVLVLICGRLVSGWGIRIVVFFIERNFFMRKRILYFVYGVRKAVQNCIWLGLVLVAWHYMFDREVEGANSFLQFVNKLMLCMLVGTLLWLVKTLIIKVLASSFHVSTFFDRIQESLFNQYVIETLSGPPLIEIQNNQEEEDRSVAEMWRIQHGGVPMPANLRAPTFKSGKVIGSGGLPPRPPRGMSFRISGPLTKNPEPKNQQEDQSITIDDLHKLNHKNVSAWNMKRLMNVVKNGVLSTLDERVQDSSQGDEAATEIRSEYEAIGAARKIFRNVAKPRTKFIYPEDLMRFLREEEALKTLNLVEGSSESERISKSNLKAWVVNAFRERRALSLTLNDTKTAVKKLHHMANVVIGVIIFVIWLVILNIATSKFLLFLSSQIVVVAFVFGNTCKTIFEAIIFVFIIHPFDVGDRCEIDGVQMFVEEMNILTTVFLRYDNQKIVYPNVTLSTKPIGNFYRSPDMGDTVDFAIHIATPVEKIGLMKEKILSYVEAKSEHWYPSFGVFLMDFEMLNMLKFSVWLRHKINHQDQGERWKRREILVKYMIEVLKELEIDYRMYPLDINIRSMPTPISNRMPPTWGLPQGN